MNFLKKVILVNIIVFVFLFFFQGNVTAQEVSRIGFSISPPIIEKELNPGGKITGTIRIENFNLEEISIEGRITNFKSKGDKGQIEITEDDINYSAKNWIILSKSSTRIAKDDFGYFDYTLEVPTDTAPGGYTAAALFTFRGFDKDIEALGGQTNAKILQEIASIFIIQIPGDSEEKIIIKEFSPLTTLFLYPTIKLYALLENVGNTHQKPYGNLVIKDVFGNTVRTVDVFGKNVLRETRRLYEEEFEFQNIGFYSVDINIYYGNIERKKVSATTYFISLNIYKIILILLGILFAYLLIRVGRKYIKIHISFKKPERDNTKE